MSKGENKGRNFLNSRRLCVEMLENRELLSVDCAVDVPLFLEKEACYTTLQDDNQFCPIEIASKLSESSKATTTLGGVCTEKLLYTVKTREEMENVTEPTGPYDFLSSAFALMEQEKLIPSSDEESISSSSDDLMIIPSDEALVDWSFNEVDFVASYSGETRGSGGTGTSGGTGGNGGGYVTTYLSGGEYYLEGEDMYVSYDNLPTGCGISATVTGIPGATVTVNQTSSGSGQIIIHTKEDYSLGGDKEGSILLSLSGGAALFSPSSSSTFNVTVLERPEFIAYPDSISSGSVVYNDDIYRTYVNDDDIFGAKVQVKGGNVTAKGGSQLRYRLVTPSPYFQVDSQTGAISLRVNAKEIVSLSGEYIHQIIIRAYESRMVSGASGGGAWTDDAVVNISIASWNVNRNCAFTAGALPIDGCTIKMLATEVGLSLEQYQNWLTVTNGDYVVELFDGSYKLARDIVFNDVLAQSSLKVFEVPNTIYAIWGFDPQAKASMHWVDNLQHMNQLGFHICYFENDCFDYAGEFATSKVFNDIYNLSSLKRLHGIYITSHGDGTSACFGSTDDPTWEAFWKLRLNSTLSFNPNIPATWCINHALFYKLGSLIVHACYSANSGASELVSTQEATKLFSGVTSSNDHHAFATLWGCKQNLNGTYTIGGEQKTKFIYNVSLGPDWLPL